MLEDVTCIHCDRLVRTTHGYPARDGMCWSHYQRKRKHGDPLAGKAKNGLGKTFLDAAVSSTTDDCILWPYAKTGGGYGSYLVDGKHWKAHAWVLAQLVPPPFDGAICRHGPCHNRLCVNPRHLSWGTHWDNHQDRKRDGTYAGFKRNKQECWSS